MTHDPMTTEEVDFFATRLHMTPEEVRYLEGGARRHLNKPFGDLTADDWGVLPGLLQAEAGAQLAAAQADHDRAGAALAEAEQCGCRIEAPVFDDGGPDVGRGRVVHTCGRSA